MRLQCRHPYTRINHHVLTPEGLPTVEAFPCGKCAICRKRNAADWVFRLQCESDAHLSNTCFITLTYSNENLTYFNEKPILVKRDLQLFFKRLRKYFSGKNFQCKSIRYYAVGEYGPHTHRPHYHAIIFGLPATSDTYKAIDRCWQKGFIGISEVNPARISYVANYVLYSFLYDNGQLPKESRPFRLVSRRTGIGSSYLTERRKAYIRKNLRQAIIYRGRPYRLPKYFKDKLNLSDEEKRIYKEGIERFYVDELRAYNELYGSIDAARSGTGLPLMIDEFYRHFVDSIKHDFIIHKLKRTL